MTLVETAQVMDILCAAYPRFYINASDSEKINANKLWSAMFNDYDVELVCNAVKSFIASDTKGFPPVPGMIIDKIVKIKKQEQLTGMEAWSLVNKAIRNGIYRADEEFSKLPKDIQRVLSSPETLRSWAVVEDKTANTVIQSNFIKAFNSRIEIEREYLSLPNDVKDFIKIAADKFSLVNAISKNEIENIEY